MEVLKDEDAAVCSAADAEGEVGKDDVVGVGFVVNEDADAVDTDVVGDADVIVDTDTGENSDRVVDSGAV